MQDFGSECIYQPHKNVQSRGERSPYKIGISKRYKNQVFCSASLFLTHLTQKMKVTE
jgi:hypothetical protein